MEFDTVVLEEEYGEPKKFSKLAWALFGLAGLVILVGGFFAVKNIFSAAPADPNASPYSAVFLANGQVYFGVISGDAGNYLVLKNIFYLQAQQSLQSASQTQPFTLVKLGQELHGPTDEMHINRSQILFYESLRNDSSVVKSMEDYKAQ
jgi:hypothetical protein